MEYTNGPNRVYMSTSFEEYQKLDRENMYYTRHGDGRLYWKQLTGKSVIGCTSMEISNELGRAKEPDMYINENIIFAIPDFEDTKKRLNTLDVEWTFPTVDELEDLKKFLNSTYFHIIHKFNKSAEDEFKKVYNVNLKAGALDETHKNMDEYERRINRYVRDYHVLGIDNETNQINTYIVQWNDYNSIKFIERNMDKFFKIANYVILDY